MITLMMEAVSSYETLANFHETTRRNIPEDGRLHFGSGSSSAVRVV
jgi:hypothetical protein